MKRNFAVADNVRVLAADGAGTAAARERDGHLGKITRVESASWLEIGSESCNKLGGNYYVIIDDSFDCWPVNLELIEESKPSSEPVPKFIVHSGAVLRTFAELPEARAFIKEFAAKDEKLANSVRLYHVAKVEKVVFTTSVTFKAIDEKPAKKAAKAK